MKKYFLCLVFIFILIGQSKSSEIISEIEDHWNDIKSMSGSFIQIDHEGNITEGQFYFLKPYQSKFNYDNQEESIITNKSLMRIVDKDGYQIDSYAIGQNILKEILSDELDFKNTFELISLKSIDEFYLIKISFKNESSSKGANLFFDRNTLDLKKWEIYDKFNNKTYLEFTKIKKNIFISQNLFVVKYNK